MSNKALAINQELKKIIEEKFAYLNIKTKVKIGSVQFYLKKVFGPDYDGNELLICIRPTEDKVTINPRRISHDPYRLEVRIISKKDFDEIDGGVEDLQAAVNSIRLALMPKNDDPNSHPLKEYSSNPAKEPFSTKYPQPEINIPVVSAVMTLEINFSENFK